MRKIAPTAQMTISMTNIASPRNLSFVAGDFTALAYSLSSIVFSDSRHWSGVFSPNLLLFRHIALA
jgi:hypothetical protein